jgi:hypothetical protein
VKIYKNALCLGINPTTLEFTYYNANAVAGWSVHQSRRIFFLKKRGKIFVNFYNAGVVAQDRRIGSRTRSVLTTSLHCKIAIILLHPDTNKNRCKAGSESRVARCKFFKPKIPIWVIFGGPWNEESW